MPKFMRMTLRIPTELYSWVKKESEAEGRTLTAQIIETLKEAKKARQETA